MVEFAVLGPLEVTGGHERVILGGAKERALLALLLIEPNQVVSVDRLVDDLWDGDPPESASVSLRVLVSRLRKALATVDGADAVVTRAPGYVLNVDTSALDAARFESLVERGRAELAAGQATAAASTLRDALGLWRGRAFAEVADAPWARSEAARLEEARLSAVEERVDADLACGRHSVLVGELEALCAAHPLSERLWSQRMVALYRSGRQADALRVYQDLRATLADELGLDPTPELAALEQRILTHDPALSWPDTGPADPLAAPRAALPTGVVSFLLTDIEGSTALWDKNHDAMAAALERHDTIIAEVVHAAGGQVLKSKGEGDALLAVFIRASDAVTAALEAQAALGRERWPGELALRVRMAIHTGEAHERDDDYFGPTLNRAARIRSLATGGQVLVSRATADIVRDRLADDIALVDRGQHELRGLGRDEQVFELVTRVADTEEHPQAPGPLELPLPPPVANAARGFFVGRDDEVTTANAAWMKATIGERHTLLVSGEPGIGKTRLACETARHAHAEGAVVLFGRCDDDLGVPYQPFAEALSSFVAACPTESLASFLGELGGELSRLVPEIARRCPSLPAPMQADPATERVRLFEAVNVWLVALAQRSSGVVVVLDDLHWAAAPTLALLRHLARSNDQASVLVLGTYRHTDLDRAHGLADMLADLRRHDSVDRLALRGLDPEGTTAFVEGFAGQSLADVERDLARGLHAETDGNPFFMAEVLRHLVETGAVRRDDGRWVTTVATVAEAGLPEGVREVIGRRLSRLSPASNQALAVAAVVGPSFALNLLERVPDSVADRSTPLLDALDEAVRAGVLTEAPGGYAFAHALVRQSVYGELTSARRARLHRHVGEAIEELPDADAQAAALAHHFAEAALDGQINKATHYALAAGQRAIEQLAYEEAVSIIERGLSLLALDPAPDPARRADLSLVMATARWTLGDRAGATEAARQAFDDAVQLTSGERAARAAILLTALAEYLVTNQFVPDACHAALALLGDDHLALRSRVLAGLARYQAVGQMRCDLARGTSAEALELARRSQEPAVIAAALFARLTVIAGTGLVEEQLALLHEQLELARRLGDVRGTVEGLLLGLGCRLEAGDLAGVRRDLQTLRDIASEQQSDRVTPLLIAADAGLALMEGRFDEAEEKISVAVGLGHDDQVLLTIYAGFQMNLRLQRGLLHEARAFIEEVGPRYPQVPFEAYLAMVSAELGDTEAARALLLRLTAEELRELPYDIARSSWMAFLAQTCAHVVDVDCAAAVERGLRAFRGQLLVAPGTTLTHGAADRYLGMLAATQRRWSEAEANYRAALELDGRVGSPVFVAETSLWYGRMLLERDEIGDRERGVELLVTALTTADELGMAWVAQEARRLLRPPLPLALRPREGMTFVGRAAELDRLTAQWNDVQAGARRLLLVVGEPGIGKTRLAGELAAHAHAQNATVLYGRCDEDAGVAYQPFAEALRGYAASCPPDELTAHVDRFGGDLARLVPELTRRVPDLPDPPATDPESERLRLFDAVTALLASASARAPVVLVLDDLHWATKPTLLLLRHILRSSEPMRVLLIGTYRDTDLDRTRPLADSLAGLQRETTNVERLALRGLAADEVAAYVEAVGGQSLGDDEIALARAVHAETEGNPFFVTEVLRHLVETGLAHREDGRWVLKARRVEDLGLPEGVRDIVSQRLSRLSEGANQALAVAAVIGPIFSLAVLERVPDARAGDADLLDALDDALHAGIVIDAGRSTYAFAHALIRQTLYTELSSARRTRLHRRVGEAIEGLPDADRHVDALAHHFAEAAIDGQVAKAASYALSAGRAAMERLACEEAVSVFERGLATLDLDGTGDLAMRADLLVALADARQVAGDLAGSRAAALEAATMARTLGSSDRLASVAAILTRESPVGLADPAAAAVCEEALLGLGDDERALRARVMASLARHRTWTEASGGIELAAQAIELARQIDDPRTLAAVLSNAGQALSGSPAAEEELNIADEVVAIARHLGDTRQLADGLSVRAVARLALGDIDGFDADHTELAELATTLRSRFHMALALCLRALRATVDGRFDDAESLVAEMMTHGGHDPAVVTFQVGHLAILRWEQGRHAELIPFVSAFHNDERPAMVGLRAYLSLAYAQTGETAQAKALLDALVADDLAGLPRDPTWTGALSFLAESSALLADADSASVIYPSLQPFAGQLIHTGRVICLGAADRYLGMLAAILGHHDEAEAHYLAATALAERIGSRPHLARTQMWHAKLLLARDEAGDGERAIDLLAQSAATAGELGMQAVAAETTSLLASHLA